jgi:hypothetical protein
VNGDAMLMIFVRNRLEFGSECYCGNEINTAGGGAQIECPDQGLMICGGNSKQLCGGPSLMTYFYSETL